MAKADPHLDALILGEHPSAYFAAALLRQNSKPTEKEVREALDRNLCRCGSQNRMVRAILRAANEMAAT